MTAAPRARGTGAVNAPDSPLLNLAEACSYLRRGKTWVRENADAIGVIRDGKRLAFFQSDLDQWLAGHRTQTVAEPVQDTRKPVDIRSPRQIGHGPTNPLDGLPWDAAAPRAQGAGR